MHSIDNFENTNYILVDRIDCGLLNFMVHALRILIPLLLSLIFTM